ncbi:MAG: M48 family metallopeptidase [Woeseiaceae bacterium]
MNFFEAQDKTRRNTRWLILIYFVATIGIALAVTLAAEFAVMFAGITQPGGASNIQPFTSPLRSAAIGGIVLGVILLASAYRILQLRSGGARVAQEMGATQISTDVDDPLRQRLRNVVEEMSIASGVPVPDIFVMESESAINAFAAGFTTSDAAIAVTRGALEQLTREELQGVVAHEFSHILNGDMRLNVKMMGILFGIIIIGQIGRLIMHSSTRRRGLSSGRSRDGGNSLVFVGLVLFVLGSIGVFIARLIRAGVSRQREYLADASAVQFTRQTDGIAGALAKIGGLNAGSRLTTVDTEEVSHMLIARGARAAWFSALASHPPLADRIQKLDPSFLRGDVPTPKPPKAPPPMNALVSALSADNGDIRVESVSPAERIGSPGDSEIALAAAIRKSIPGELYDAAHSREWAFYLAITLALSSEPHERERQLDALETQIGPDRCRRISRYADQLDDLGSRYRLPLLELCFPALKQRPAGQLEFLLSLVETIHGLLRKPDIRDTVFRTTLAVSLDASINPGRPARWKTTHLEKAKTGDAAQTLLWLVSQFGHDSQQAANAAYQTGNELLGLDQKTPDRPISIAESANALRNLQGLIGRDQQKLIDALVATISHDGIINVAESEFMRMISVSLNCPLPPIIDSAVDQAMHIR